uniref:FP protein C-terminal domain-containing protein n=1 Tax=Rhodnius prolixus TaxID=13249 RepID=T1I2R5_RHOPR
MSDKQVNIGEHAGAVSGDNSITVSETLISSITNISSAMKSLTSEMKAMRSDFDIIKEENKRISLAVASCDGHLKKALREFKQETNQLKDMINKLEKQNLLLKSELIQTQQSTHYNAIKILNFPNAEKEDPLEVFKKVCGLINFDFNFEFINDCFCLNAKNNKFPPMIIIKFLREKDKLSLLKFLKEKKIRLKADMFEKGNSSVPIYISEFLSPELNQLFKDARSFKRSDKLKYVWVRNGRIFVKVSENSKPKIIRSNLDLEESLGKHLVGLEKKDRYEETDFDDSEATDISEVSKGSRMKKRKKGERKQLSHERIDQFFRPPAKKE